MEFFPKETQPHRFRKGTSGHQENQDAVDRKGKKKKKRNKHKITIHFCSNCRVKIKIWKKKCRLYSPQATVTWAGATALEPG